MTLLLVHLVVDYENEELSVHIPQNKSNGIITVNQRNG